MLGKRPPLSKSVIDHAQPVEKQYDLWDGWLPGFGIRIGISGVKTYILRYRAHGGGRRAPQRFYVIGRHGVLTLDQARRRATVLLADVSRGEDPAAERKDRRRELNVTDLVNLYEREGCIIQRGKRIGEPMKPLTKKYTLSRLRHHVVPLLGSKRISDINAGDIEKFVKDVAEGKTASDQKAGAHSRIIVRGGDGAARKVVRDLSALLSFAIRRELLDRNPVERAAVRKVDNQRDRYLTIEELKRLGKAFENLEARGVNPKAITIARLWALTGCRRQEIAGLKWSEVNFEEGLLIFSDTKTGKSVRPLNAAAMAILKGVKKEGRSPYVFPAESGKSFFQGTKRIWNDIREEADLPDITPHTLRHTVGSTAISSGEAFALTGAILGHTNARSTAIYAHVQDQPMKRAADRVGSRIAVALGLEAPKKRRTRATAPTT